MADEAHGGGSSTSAPTAPEVTGNPELVAAVLDALPGAAFVIDELGTVLWGSRQAVELVRGDGQEPSDLAGRSVLDFVTPDTAWAYASTVALASDYPDVTMGPLRISYLTGTGERRDADMWATNRLDDPVIRGIVCLVTEKTAAAGMTDAVSAVAAGAPAADVADLVARALTGAPTAAEVTVLAPVGDRFTTIARSAGAPVLEADLTAEPWRPVVYDGIRQLYNEPGDLPPSLAPAARDASFVAAWVEPVLSTSGTPALAALVIWKPRPGPPSPNQLTSIHEAAAILALACRPT